MTVAESSTVPARYTPQAFFDKHPAKTHLDSPEQYAQLYKQSIEDPDTFFGAQARELLSWQKDFSTVRSGSFENGDVSWFLEGQLNACYNCVDRHAAKNPDKVALIFEGDDERDSRKVTFGELQRQVSLLANVLTSFGVKKGDTVAVYLPMIPEAWVTLLAITRIGAVHSTVFGGFSSGALRDRINDAQSKVVITSDEGRRGGKTVQLKNIVDTALKSTPSVEKVLVFQRTGAPIPWTEGRDFWWHEETAKHPSYSTPATVNSEDPLFLLYTSGSTGSPKGLVHSTAGFLLGAIASTKYVFDVHPDHDVFFTAGDIGWITGHTYGLYGPLLMGVTTVVFEGTPVYPTMSRYWQIIEKYRVSQFYVAPTALRMLKRGGEEYIKGHDLSSLRTLGSVGEPIAGEIWEWYHEHIGNGECHITDTYWQTETGSHIIAPLAGISPMKPGSASFPFFGIEPVILDAVTGKELEGNDVEGVLAVRHPWPSMARSVWGNHQRYVDTYLTTYPGLYFTGDGAARDADGYYWIRGRVDDVVNVSGHRLSTAEIEAALLLHETVAESAVVGIADDLTGQAVVAFVALKNGYDLDNRPDLRKELVVQIRKEIGPFAAPKTVIIVDDLPKTRSGKTMRRILRKVVSGEQDTIGDLSTLNDPTVVEDVIAAVAQQFK